MLLTRPEMDFFPTIFTFEDKQAGKIGTTNATSGTCTRHSPFSCSFEATAQQVRLSPALFQGRPASLLPQAFLGSQQAPHVSYTQDVWSTRMLLPNVKLTLPAEKCTQSSQKLAQTVRNSARKEKAALGYGCIGGCCLIRPVTGSQGHDIPYAAAFGTSPLPSCSYGKPPKPLVNSNEFQGTVTQKK